MYAMHRIEIVEKGIKPPYTPTITTGTGSERWTVYMRRLDL